MLTALLAAMAVLYGQLATEVIQLRSPVLCGTCLLVCVLRRCKQVWFWGCWPRAVPSLLTVSCCHTLCPQWGVRR